MARNKAVAAETDLTQEEVASEPVETSFSKKELQHFMELIVDKRHSAQEDIDGMRGQLADAREQAENDTAYSFHMADAGTDAMEREKLFLMIARQQKYIGYLDRAIERIENRTYGVCKVTGQPISKERLEAVPHTEISIEAKLQQQKK
ncbi:MAG: TraR/DksA C4-type zinc finger protein [Bacteroidetes bacterium]|nr:TraR/DksA C4-type zinc finger protein [Bacteroidota bacterium]